MRSLSEIVFELKERAEWHLTQTKQYKEGRNGKYHKYMFQELTRALHRIVNATMTLPSDFS